MQGKAEMPAYISPEEIQGKEVYDQYGHGQEDARHIAAEYLHTDEKGRNHQDQGQQVAYIHGSEALYYGAFNIHRLTCLYICAVQQDGDNLLLALAAVAQALCRASRAG